LPIKAVSLDFWDTIYQATSTPARVQRRHEALQSMLRALGRELPADEFKALYTASYEESERWWREHRGYTTADRIRWLLGQIAIERPDDCEHVTRAVEAIDESLIAVPPPLLPGAADGIRRLASRFRLAIVSDTGFPSGAAQNRLLEQDGLLQYFTATVYSGDIGHCKPRPEPFLKALELLDSTPVQVHPNSRSL
jgi:FMN phosphatase YigB (HAD superfamily)